MERWKRTAIPFPRSARSARRLTAAALAIVLLLIAAGCRKPPTGGVENVYQQAWRLLREGSLDEAGARLEPLRGIWLDGSSRDAARLRLLKAEILLGQSRLDQAASLLAKPIPDDFTLRIRQSIDWADELSKLDYNTAALALLEETAKAASRQGTADPTSLMRGVVCARMGDYARAEDLLRQAWHRAMDSQDDYDASMALINLSFCFLKRERYEETIKYAGLAAEAAGRCQARRMLSAAWGNSSTGYAHLGDFDFALELRRKAIAVQEAMKDPRLLQQSLGEMGTLQLYAGELQQAADYYQRAYDLARTMPGTADASLWAGNLAETNFKLGNLAEAERWNNESRKLKIAAGVKTLGYVDLTAAEIAAGRGARQEAEQLLHQALGAAGGNFGLQWSVHAELAKLYSGAAEYGKADQHFSAALALIETKRKEFGRIENQLTFLSRLIGFYQEYVDALMERGDGRQALRVAESSRARILQERLGRKEATATAAIEEFQKASRRTGATLLSYWLAPRRGWVWVVTPGNVRWLPLPGRDELDRLSRSYRDTVEKSGRDPLTDESGRKLSQALLGPVLALLGAAPVVIVAPDGPLSRVNLETLPVNGRYWVEDATVSVTPSLSLLTSSPEPLHRAPLSLLAVGDAEEAGPAYGKLKFARQELQSVARHMRGAVILEGPRATPEAYTEARPQRFRLIHFAAHAEADAQNPLDAAIILSPDKDRRRLLVRDVARHPLQADLVTVSACRSAGVRAYSGEGLVGFAWGFLQAGAGAVVADLWNVNDESTAALMAALYEGLATGKPARSALREAKLSLLHGRPEWRRPFYWAPFQIYVR